MTNPSRLQIYAVNQGTYLGEMWVFIEHIHEDLGFLSLPDNINRICSNEKFEFALDHDILQLVENLPDEIYQVCEAQYYANIRRKQSTSPGSLDCESEE